MSPVFKLIKTLLLVVLSFVLAMAALSLLGLLAALIF
jgi:hypothetical protein